MPREIGTRIGAILKADAESVHLIGFGVYAGDEIPSEDAGGMAEMLREAGCPNPKLVMDDGQVAWGCECWWGGEDAVRAKIGDRKIIPVNMTEVRKG